LICLSLRKRRSRHPSGKAQTFRSSSIPSSRQ